LERRGRWDTQLLDDLGLKRKETRNLKRKRQIAGCGEISGEESMDLSQDRLLNQLTICAHSNFIYWLFFHQNWHGGSHTFLKVFNFFFFHCLNPSGRTMVDSASNRNEDQRYLLLGKGGQCLMLTNLPLPFADLPEILGASVSWHTNVLSRPVMRWICSCTSHICLFIWVTFSVQYLHIIPQNPLFLFSWK